MYSTMDQKLFLESQTIRGGVQLLFIVLSLIGVQVSETEKESLAQTIISTVGGLWAIWSFVQVVRGRIKAKNDLVLKK